MSIIVQKFGGSSVADAEKMRRVAGRVKAARDEGHQVVVVVSAMGKTTDNLIALASEVNADPNDREMDMLLSTGEQVSASILAMTLHNMGTTAVSMTGPQAGIFTDTVHTKAKIMDIKPDRLHEGLDRHGIVIVAGFQGLTPSQDVATLGRGGSDTTAVALAAAVKAERCQIFTDVDGVYTTDPRIVPEARRLDEIACDEMLELASLGAKVLQSRSVEFAKKYNVKIEVLTSFEVKPGTIVSDEVKNMENILVRGIASDKNQAKITLQGVADHPGLAASIFGRIAEANINVDMIVQNVSAEGVTDVSFTVPRTDLSRTRAAVDAIVKNDGVAGALMDEHVAKVSIVGVGMRSHTGVAQKMFSSLAEKGINIQMISTSEIKVSVVIHEDKADDAVQVLHKAFELEKAS